MIIKEDSNNTKKELNLKGDLEEIKKALNKRGLKFDSISKAVIENNLNSEIIIQGDGNTNEIIGNTFVTRHPSEIDEIILQAILMSLRNFEVKYQISNKSILLQTVKNTSGYQSIPSIYQMLLKNGYTIAGIRDVDANNENARTEKIGIDQNPKGQIVVTLGNMPK